MYFDSFIENYYGYFYPPKQEYKDGIVQFDMLIRATKKIQKEGYREKVQYVMIDEYQDTSLVRFNLVKEILNFTNAKLMVVGDDFQSIYRFSNKFLRHFALCSVRFECFTQRFPHYRFFLPYIF